MTPPQRIRRRSGRAATAGASSTRARWPEIGQRIEEEGTERVAGLVLLVRVLIELGGELEAVLVVLAEPRQLVHAAQAQVRALGAESGVTTKADGALAAGAIGEGGAHEDGAVRQ